MPPKKKLPTYLSHQPQATSAESSNSGAISNLPMKRKGNESTTEIATKNRKINPSGRIFLSGEVPPLQRETPCSDVSTISRVSSCGM